MSYEKPHRTRTELLWVSGILRMQHTLRGELRCKDTTSVELCKKFAKIKGRHSFSMSAKYKRNQFLRNDY